MAAGALLAEFSQEEKSAIVDAIAKFAAASDKRISEILRDDLIGYVYTLAKEDRRSQLRDAREYSTMLNACGRTGRAGVGIAICIGDRNNALTTGEEILKKYRRTLRDSISSIFGERWRLADDGKIAFVNGDGILDEDMLGAISSLAQRITFLSGQAIICQETHKGRDILQVLLKEMP